jgi:hypothetical protein
VLIANELAPEAWCGSSKRVLDRGARSAAAGRAKERLVDMEVSRNERFEFSVGLAEGEADYRARIMYQSGNDVVNKD